MSLPRQYEASSAKNSLCSDFTPVRLAAWLAIVLVLSKGFSLDRSRDHWWLLDLSMASYCDVLFALALGTVASLGLWAASRRSVISSGLRRAFVGICVLCAFYSVIAAGVFNYFGRPLSYDLLKLVHGVAAVESSILNRLTLPVAAALIIVPGSYYALARRLARRRKAPVLLVAMLLAWSALGCWQYYQRPKPYFMPHLSMNPHIELVRSTWNGMVGLGRPLLQADYPREYQDEFKPRAWREAIAERDYPHVAAAGVPPKNVIVIVLESVGTKYLSLYGSSYDTTPTLVEEAAHALVFENFYAHVPYTFCSFMALTFSIYPGVPWCYAPGETFARGGARSLPPTLAFLLKERGARTAFLCNGDLEWAGMSYVLENQGYDTIEDYRAMGGRLPDFLGSRGSGAIRTSNSFHRRETRAAVLRFLLDGPESRSLRTRTRLEEDGLFRRPRAPAPCERLGQILECAASGGPAPPGSLSRLARPWIGGRYPGRHHG